MGKVSQQEEKRRLHDLISEKLKAGDPKVLALIASFIPVIGIDNWKGLQDIYNSSFGDKYKSFIKGHFLESIADQKHALRLTADLWNQNRTNIVNHPNFKKVLEESFDKLPEYYRRAGLNYNAKGMVTPLFTKEVIKNPVSPKLIITNKLPENVAGQINSTGQISINELQPNIGKKPTNIFDVIETFTHETHHGNTIPAYGYSPEQSYKSAIEYNFTKDNISTEDFLKYSHEIEALPQKVDFWTEYDDIGKFIEGHVDYLEKIYKEGKISKPLYDTMKKLYIDEPKKMAGLSSKFNLLKEVVSTGLDDMGVPRNDHYNHKGYVSERVTSDAAAEYMKTLTEPKYHNIIDIAKEGNGFEANLAYLRQFPAGNEQELKQAEIVAERVKKWKTMFNPEKLYSYPEELTNYSIKGEKMIGNDPYKGFINTSKSIKTLSLEEKIAAMTANPYERSYAYSNFNRSIPAAERTISKEAEALNAWKSQFSPATLGDGAIQGKVASELAPISKLGKYGKVGTRILSKALNFIPLLADEAIAKSTLPVGYGKPDINTLNEKLEKEKKMKQLQYELAGQGASVGNNILGTFFKLLGR